MHSGLAWDDLVYVLAVGRAGSLSGAARSLRVNHSTVFRRVSALEERIGARLFDRQREGYVPTLAGEEVIAIASKVEEDVTALERRISGKDLRPSGVVRVTTSDVLIEPIVPLCARFRQLYPEICIELTTGHQVLDLGRRDADVAIRASASPPENLYGRRIAGIALCPYASKQYRASRAGGDPEEEHDWVGVDDSRPGLPAHAYLRANAPPERIGLKATSFLAARAAAVAGMGVAVLPCYVGDPVDELERVGEVLPHVAVSLWLLVHEDLRKTARVRAFTDFIWEELRRLRPYIEGKAPPRH
jgi:DNA-binding transcriptional LysR family regulator